MRALLLTFVCGALFGCGGGSEDGKPQDRTEVGGGLPNDGSNGNATVACTKPQLNLQGKVVHLAYDREVGCGKVTASTFARMDDELYHFTMDVGDARVFEVTFKEDVMFFPYTSPARVVVRLGEDAALGDCPTEFGSTATAESAVAGSFEFSGAHYLNADGSCGEPVDGEITGRWTQTP